MKLVCPRCGQPQEKDQFALTYTCDFCKASSSASAWWNASKKVKVGFIAEPIETKELPARKGLQVPAKIRFTKFGSVELKVLLPQNYLRVMFGLEKLPKEKLIKSESKEV
jgi:hypothetical protein